MHRIERISIPMKAFLVTALSLTVALTLSAFAAGGGSVAEAQENGAS